MILCGGLLGHLRRVGIGEPGDVSGKLDDRPLKSVADAEIGNPLASRVLGGRHHASAAALAEAWTDDDADRIVEQPHAVRILEGLGLDILQIDFQAMSEPAMMQGLVDALVRVLVFDIFPDEMKRDLVLGLPNTLDQIRPLVHPALGLRQMQPGKEDAVEPLAGEIQRDFVNARDVARRDDGLLVDVAEQGDLPLHVAFERPVRAAKQHVGLDADRPKVADAVLRRLGLQFAADGMNGTSVRWM